MTVNLHPGAEQDLIEAASFYEREGSPILPARFVREFKRIVDLVSEHPEIGSARGKGLREIPMGGFPYTVIYRLDTSQITILVVKHDRRRPGYGSRRS